MPHVLGCPVYVTKTSFFLNVGIKCFTDIARDKVTRQCHAHITTFEERGEPKRNRIEVLLLTSLSTYRWTRWADRTYYCTMYSSLLNVSRFGLAVRR